MLFDFSFGLVPDMLPFSSKNVALQRSTAPQNLSQHPRGQGFFIKAIDLGEDEVVDKTIEGGKLHQIRSQSGDKHGRELSYSSSPVVKELWN